MGQLHWTWRKLISKAPFHGKIMPASIYLPNKHFLSAYSVPGNVVGTGDKEISKTYSSFLGPQLTLIEKAWMGLNAIRQGTTNCWPGNHSPGQGNLFFQQFTELCQHPSPKSQQETYSQAVMWFLWSRTIFKLLCISREFSVNPTTGFMMVGFHSPDCQVIVPSCQALSSKARSSHWSLLQFKQKCRDLALSDQEYCCVSNSGSPEEGIKIYNYLFTFPNFQSIINL